jgi:ABC-type glutathione transport system ATPase component
VTDATLAASGLTKTFGMGRNHSAVTAVDNVSFSIGPGESLGLVGESGSGKSTIARLLVGLDRPDAGTLSVGGHDRLTRTRNRSERLRRARQVQMVFQDPYGSLDRRLSVGRSLEHAMTMHGLGGTRDQVRKRIVDLLERVRLTAAHAESKPHQLSGGQRQRVAIARALAIEPDILVLDEAVSALDVSVQAQVLELLDDIRRSSGVGLLFVSHDLAVVQEITDRVLVLFKGVVVEEGATSEVLHQPQHLYTQLLVSSVPGPGWDPSDVIERRRQFQASLSPSR